MSISLYDASVGSYLQIVESACGVLRKGAEHCAAQERSVDELVDCKLHETMAGLHFQVVSVVHHSLGAIKGVQEGVFAPPSGYPEMDYAGLQAFLDETLASLRALQPEAINALAGGQVVFRFAGNEIPFTTENFLLSFSLPNFYFHATTLYDVLRAQGVPLGKMDYLGRLKMARA